MQLRRDNETDQERKSGPYYGMPSQKYENQNPYTNQNPYAYEDPYVVHTVPPVQPVRAKQTIPIVTILIIVANVIAAIMCIGIENTFQLAGINYEYITINHEYRRLISYMFIHADFEHLIGNMVALFLFGKLVEQRLGSLRMAIIYFGSGVGAGFLSMEIAHKSHPESPRSAAGASGAVFGIICAKSVPPDYGTEECRAEGYDYRYCTRDWICDLFCRRECGYLWTYRRRDCWRYFGVCVKCKEMAGLHRESVLQDLGDYSDNRALRDGRW